MWGPFFCSSNNMYICFRITGSHFLKSGLDDGTTTTTTTTTTIALFAGPTLQGAFNNAENNKLRFPFENWSRYSGVEKKIKKKKKKRGLKGSTFLVPCKKKKYSWICKLIVLFAAKEFRINKTTWDTLMIYDDGG